MKHMRREKPAKRRVPRLFLISPGSSRRTKRPLFADQVDFETFSKSDFRAVKVKECSAVPKSKKLLKFVLDDGTGTDRVILS